jgi:hypothetical protein
MSSLKPMVTHILETDEPTPHIPRLLVLLKSMRYVDDEIVAIFHVHALSMGLFPCLTPPNDAAALGVGM